MSAWLATGVCMKKSVSEVRRLYRLGLLVEQKSRLLGWKGDEDALTYLEGRHRELGMHEAMQLIAPRDEDET